MKHKIFELATIEDVPEILKIQHQAFAPQCKALGWNDCLPLNETLDSAYEDFGNYKTFKIQNDDDAMYDLSGRKIRAAANSSFFTLHSSFPKKGVYILNGKKYIIQ